MPIRAKSNTRGAKRGARGSGNIRAARTARLCALRPYKRARSGRPRVAFRIIPLGPLPPEGPIVDVLGNFGRHYYAADFVLASELRQGGVVSLDAALPEPSIVEYRVHCTGAAALFVADAPAVTSIERVDFIEGRLTQAHEADCEAYSCASRSPGAFAPKIRAAAPSERGRTRRELRAALSSSESSETTPAMSRGCNAVIPRDPSARPSKGAPKPPGGRTLPIRKGPSHTPRSWAREDASLFPCASEPHTAAETAVAWPALFPWAFRIRGEREMCRRNVTLHQVGRCCRNASARQGFGGA